VPTYDVVDIQVNKKVVRKNSFTFKLGASNVLNNKQIQVFGGPRVGRMAYFSILFELDKL
jgi:iron complex outermembrane receptor protein